MGMITHKYFFCEKSAENVIKAEEVSKVHLLIGYFSYLYSALKLSRLRLDTVQYISKGISIH